MAAIRVMAIFQGGSNLPEDRFINTFHFADTGPIGPTYEEECRQRVIDFYTVESTGVSIGGFMSPYASRTATVQSYNMELPAGEREPTVESFTLAGTGAATGLPEEVALVVTLEGAAPVTPRRRGRLYLGPLNNNGLVLIGGDSTNQARPDLTSAQGIGRVIADRCTDMANYSAFQTTWCIRSVTPAENYVPIVSGHIDNAWDTQRRRGPDATDRLLWT